MRKPDSIVGISLYLSFIIIIITTTTTIITLL
jgi:hypothetical protein